MAFPQHNPQKKDNFRRVAVKPDLLPPSNLKYTIFRLNWSARIISIQGTFAILTGFSRSFMKMRNKNGPSQEPWGNSNTYTLDI